MKIDIKSKLFFLTIVPSLIILFLSIGKIVHDLESKKDLEQTRQHILEAKTISNIVHFMQIERGLSTGFIAGESNVEDLLLKIRRDLDTTLKDLKLIGYAKKNIDLSFIESIKTTREEIDSFNLSTSDVQKRYTHQIATLLDFAKIISTMMEEKSDRNYIQAYGFVSFAKENLGQIRALLQETFVKNSLTQENLIHVHRSFYIYNIAINRFKQSLQEHPFYSDLYEKMIQEESFKKIFEIINSILNTKESALLHVNPSSWFELATKSINNLKELEERLFLDAQISIDTKIKDINQTIILVSFLLFLLFSILALFMHTIVKNILFSTHLLNEEFENSLVLLDQYKSSVDDSFIVSKTDTNGIIRYVNDAFCKISGYSREELIGSSHSIIRHPDMPKETFEDLWHTIKVLKMSWSGDFKNLSKDGSTYWLKGFVKPIVDKNGNIVEYIAIKTDMTQQKEIMEYFENQLKITERNFDDMIHISKEYENAIDNSTILSRIDKNRNIIYINDKFAKISEYTIDELKGKNHAVLLSPETAQKQYEEIWNVLSSSQKAWHGVLENRKKSGKLFWTDTSILPIKNLEGNVIEYLLIRNDITPIIEQKMEIEKIAYTDLLTGYANRFDLHLDIENAESPYIAIFNLDNFRQINDFYGHEFGNLVIISIANKIYNLISQEKNLKFYRLQGDEFAVLADNFYKELFVLEVKKIIDSIKEKFSIQNKELLISCSSGVSFEDKEHLLSSANMALSTARSKNIDFLVYNESKSLNKVYEENMYWTKKLSDAIKNNDIISFYQPIVNNSNLAYEKYECLVRMRDGEKIISPFFFLEVGKKTRQYFSITKAVIEQAFEKFKNIDAEFSVNLSINDILEPDITEFILKMLQKHDIGAKVVFEIVESEYIVNFEGVIRFINEVKKYGCKIAIDDFGTGYSNFAYLIKLKADYLKIDGSLIKNIDTDKNALLVVSTIVEFSKKLGMRTIAEFVENE
ncbi:MAG: EAL domain-containing protein [Sulfurimonas sp.]|uniref:EAL domain-containing protein n=1 Tax=Sulfurimonas sp. TaxID=2022749 RepID=UPI003D0BF756